MDPFTVAIVGVLTKFAADQGATLLKEGGEAVAKAAGNLFTKVIARLKADPGEAKNAERFEKNPEAFKPAVEAAVEDQMKADPNFAAELKALLEDFDKAQKSAGVSLVATNVTATASQGSTAVGAFQVGGNASNINIGNKTTTNTSGGVNISGGTIAGDVVGRDKITKSG